MYLYSASSQSASNVLPLPVHRCWSPQASPPARYQRTLRDHGYRLAYHAICLFTPQLLPGTHSSLITEGRLRLSRPGCLVLHRGGLPIQRWSPTHALTGPSVE